MRRFEKSKYNLSVMFTPLIILAALTVLIMIFPVQSNQIISNIRNLFGNEFGVYYLLLGFIFVVIALFLAFSKYGNIKLGKSDEKPAFSTFSWATLIFTSTMAADIVFYALHEWMYYYNSTPLDFTSLTEPEKITWASSYPLFHWGVTPWIFYIIPAVAYGYMFFVKCRDKQKISEACRPILKDKVDGILGKIIDIFSILVMLVATSTTFGVATPLLSTAICKVFNIENSVWLTIGILISIALVYTIAVLSGFKGISKVSTFCIVSCSVLLCIFLFCGNTRFIVENGVNGIGNSLQNFIKMSLWTDPSRYSGNGISGFPQDWTVFYWAYWIAYSVATPFFIAKISKGRTIRNVVLGGTASGLAGTFLSFIIFGGYGLAEQAQGRIHVAEMIANGESSYDAIMEIFNSLPCTQFALVILILTMIGFYATTFDSIVHVISSYSYKSLTIDQEPGKYIKLYWSFLFILLPIALLFAGSAHEQLQGVSIIVAFPFSFIIILIVASFFKSIRKSRKIKEKH